MAHTFLTPTNIFKHYQEAKTYTDKLTVPFPEFARMADNKAQNGMPRHYPDVTSGLAAGIIQKVPKTAVQQLPTGLVETDDDNDWLPIVAQFIYSNKILPYANADYGLFEKCHLLIEGGETFGAAASYTRFDGSKLSPDVELIYWGDIFIQKGKKSGNSCNYLFYRTWWQKADLEALIDDENKRSANAKKRKGEYEPTWDTEALKAILDDATSKDQQATTPTEQDRGLDPSGIELVTGFQVGVGAKFYTFNPQTKKIVRTKTNNDPRGKMPISWFYYDIDGTNPLGRGIPQLIGPMVNLYDTRLQMQAYGDTLALAPTVIEYGEASDSFEFLPNKVVHATSKDSYSVEPITTKVTSTQDFIAGQNFIQSQVYGLVNTPHTGVSSTNGTVTDGKTPAALDMQQNVLDVDINAVVKHFESWWKDQSESLINCWFTERHGKEILQLDGETVDKLRQLEPTEDFNPETDINDKDQIIIDYDTATPALKFRVNPGTSKQEDDKEQIGLIQEAVKSATLPAVYYMGQDGWNFNLGEAYRLMFDKLGISDIEKIITKMTPKEQAAAKKQPFPIVDPPQIRLTGQIPPNAMGGALSMGGVDTSNLQLSGDQPIDLGDMYKGTTDPAIKAQIEQMAGLQPSPIQPPMTPQTQQPQLSAGETAALQDQVKQWQQMGVPDDQIQQHLQTYLAQRGQNV